MADHRVKFDIAEEPVVVPTGTLLSEAAHLAGIDIGQPCGGQGRCGRCTVRVTQGDVRRRSTLRLSSEDIAAGFALACQTVVESDLVINVPEKEAIERRLTTDRTAAEVAVPAGYNAALQQSILRVPLTLTPPNLDDQTDDWNRLKTALRARSRLENLSVSLAQIRSIAEILRARDWKTTVIVEQEGDQSNGARNGRFITAIPGLVPDDAPLLGAAVDIGTTTVTVWLVDLLTGRVLSQTAEYNDQIARGEDVISRIIYSQKAGGLEELQSRVAGTINKLITTACKRTQTSPEEIFKVTVTGNSTMLHLFLGIPAQNIRLAPFITTVNEPPPVTGKEVGLVVNPNASVDCLPGVASYVGADISAGVYASGMDDTDQINLFLDVGTNGETVLGNRDWLVTCACSAGPAFEGAGVFHGMRATRGAIEEVWIAGAGSDKPYEPSFRIIGNSKPRGICGSGLIALLAEMVITGLVDKAGNINLSLASETSRVREGEHGAEYVVAWGQETASGEDIVLTAVDIDNLKRAKAAIYAGFTVLAESVGVPLESAEQLLIGGSFGKYINVEKAVQIGLLPDMPWEKFKFLGNTSIRGAYYALLESDVRQKIRDIAGRMTYIELSADNSFYEAFTSALFLPHTDLNYFPSVQAALQNQLRSQEIGGKN
jgi:uncharacterized 2Fe-2S/4Fe-4S cluster protein (DUF4445 family)